MIQVRLAIKFPFDILFLDLTSSPLGRKWWRWRGRTPPWWGPSPRCSSHLWPAQIKCKISLIKLVMDIFLLCGLHSQCIPTNLHIYLCSINDIYPCIFLTFLFYPLQPTYLPNQPTYLPAPLLPWILVPTYLHITLFTDLPSYLSTYLSKILPTTILYL